MLLLVYFKKKKRIIENAGKCSLSCCTVLLVRTVCVFLGKTQMGTGKFHPGR